MWFFLVVGIVLFLMITFSYLIGISFSLGMRNKDGAYYDPKDNKWYSPLELTVEQKLRIRTGSHKLSKREVSEDEIKEEQVRGEAKKILYFN